MIQELFRAIHFRNMPLLEGLLHNVEDPIVSKNTLPFNTLRELLPDCVFLECLEESGDTVALQNQDISLIHYAILTTAPNNNAVEILCNYYMQLDGNNEYVTNTVDNGGNTTLHLALKYNEEPLAISLLNMGSDVHALNSDGNTPFYTAVKTGSMDTAVSMSQEYAVGMDPNKLDLNLLIAAYTGNMENVADLLAGDASVNIANTSGMTPLYYAVIKENQELVQFLLQMNASPNPELEYPLMYVAAKTGNIAIMTMLINAGTYVNATNCYGEPALYYAAIKENQDLVQFLLQNGASPNPDLACPLIQVAVETGNIEITTLLINAGAAVDATDNEGSTALHTAILNDPANPQMIEFLLWNHADPNSENNEGDTPLHYALLDSVDHNEANLAIIQLLLQYGADPSIADENGDTVYNLGLNHEIEAIRDIFAAINNPEEVNVIGDQPIDEHWEFNYFI